MHRFGAEGEHAEAYHWDVLEDGTVELRPYNNQKWVMLLTLDSTLRAGTLRNGKGQSFAINAEPEK